MQVDRFIYLRVPDKTVMGRAADRRIDPETGAIYNLKFVPPPAAAAARLVRRQLDDNEHSFRVRVQTFHSLIRRILPYFSGKVQPINAMLEPAEVHSSIHRALTVWTATADPEGVGSVDENSGKCLLCFDGPADHLCSPCGHMCGCEDCLTVVHRTSGRCPICRSRVERIQKVFDCTSATGRSPAAGSSAASVVPMDPLAPLARRDMDEVLDPGLTAADDAWSDDEVTPDVSPQQDTGITLTAAPTATVGDDGGEAMMAVRIAVPDSAQRVPADVVCVIDVSGSMCGRATYEVCVPCPLCRPPVWNALGTL